MNQDMSNINFEDIEPKIIKKNKLTGINAAVSNPKLERFLKSAATANITASDLYTNNSTDNNKNINAINNMLL